MCHRSAGLDIYPQKVINCRIQRKKQNKLLRACPRIATVTRYTEWTFPYIKTHYKKVKIKYTPESPE
jgi:hypothetical protein